MKKAVCFITALIAVMLLSSCRPAAGPIGPQGPAGSDATAGTQVMFFQNNMLPSASYAGCEDTRIWQGAQADVNYGAYSYLQVGYTGTESKRGLMKFDISALPIEAVVRKAVLTLYCQGVVSGSPAFSFHRILTDGWVQNEATWNDRASGVSWTAAGGDYLPVPASDVKTPETAAYTSWNIDRMIMMTWLDFPTKNLGLILIPEDTSSANECIFASSEAADIAKRPKLAVYYDLP